MDKEQSKKNVPALCLNNCGFFGNAVFRGYCSSCYRDHEQQQQQKQPPSSRHSSTSGFLASLKEQLSPAEETGQEATELPLSSRTSSTAAAAVEVPETKVELARSEEVPIPESGVPRSAAGGQYASSSEPASAEGSVDERKKPASRPRCHKCNKRISLAERITCRCDGLFCPQHRLPESHDCTFNFKDLERLKIRENNPKILAKKIERI